MATPPTTESDLEIIGTARKPTISDLKERGLIGLPDPDPEVLIRRAEFESEQANLKARVKWHEGEIAVSFLRAKIDAQESDDDGVSLDWDKGESTRSVEVDAERSRVEERGTTLTPRVGMLSPPDSPVANDVCGGSEKAVRVLRDRSAVQLRPYAVERDMYRQMIASGRVKA